MKNAVVREVVVKKSAKRKKTLSARLRDGVMEVSAPATITTKELDRFIEKFTLRFEKRAEQAALDKENTLAVRAHELNRKYFQGKLRYRDIRYSVNQKKRFGVCYPERGKILINANLREMPPWVQDYVIIHELTHLLYPNHSEEFWTIVRRYPKTERAIGYLMAKGIEEDEGIK